MIIAENGPVLHHADEILERKMNQYWKVANRDGKWQLLRRTEYTYSYTGNCSKVVRKLLDQQSKLPFM